MKFRVTVNVAQVRKRIGKQAALKASEATIAAMVRGALRVERTAKKNAPVAYGDLRASITHTGVLVLNAARRIYGILVGSKKRQAIFAEFGTGPVASGARLTEDAKAFIREIGYVPGQHGGWPPDEAIEDWMKRKKIPLEAKFALQRAIFEHGTKAQPFLFPALESEKATIIKEVGNAVRQVVERGA